MINQITTETSNNWPIPNYINFDLVGNEEAVEKKLSADFDAQVRSKATGRYNCHGLTFGSRRTCIEDATSIPKILEDDSYRPVDSLSVLPGDVILYFDQHDGTVSHSGIVTEVTNIFPKSMRIISKWGVNGAEFLHWAHKSPYGTDYRFYRVDHSKESIILSDIILSK